MGLLHTPHVRYAWLVIASAIAGVMNAMAGGGSFISFPAMLGVGVPPVQANATNTVALWPGQAVSLLTLRRDVQRAFVPAVAIACVVGSVAGAEVLLHTPQRTFLNLIPWLILGGTVLFGLSTPVSRWLRGRVSHTDKSASVPTVAIALSLMPITFYIGYFGAGGGFLVMTVLALFGMEDMYQLNAMKIVTACLSNFIAIVTFILSGAIVWHDCLISMVFAAAGGYLGARLARRTNPDMLRVIVVCTGLVIAGYFFWRRAHVAA